MSYDVADPMKHNYTKCIPRTIKCFSYIMYRSRHFIVYRNRFLVFCLHNLRHCIVFLFIPCSRVMTRLLSYFSIPVSTRLPSTVKQIKENYTVIVHWPLRLQWTKEHPCLCLYNTTRVRCNNWTRQSQELINSWRSLQQFNEGWIFLNMDTCVVSV